MPGYLRYADDLLLFGDSKEQLWGWRDEVADAVARLRLLLHEAKTQVRPAQAGVKFLGFVLWPDQRRACSSGRSVASAAAAAGCGGSSGRAPNRHPPSARRSGPGRPTPVTPTVRASAATCGNASSSAAAAATLRPVSRTRHRAERRRHPCSALPSVRATASGNGRRGRMTGSGTSNFNLGRWPASRRDSAQLRPRLKFEVPDPVTLRETFGRRLRRGRETRGEPEFFCSLREQGGSTPLASPHRSEFREQRIRVQKTEDDWDASEPPATILENR